MLFVDLGKRTDGRRVDWIAVHIEHRAVARAIPASLARCATVTRSVIANLRANSSRLLPRGIFPDFSLTLPEFGCATMGELSRSLYCCVQVLTT